MHVGRRISCICGAGRRHALVFHRGRHFPAGPGRSRGALPRASLLTAGTPLPLPWRGWPAPLPRLQWVGEASPAVAAFPAWPGGRLWPPAFTRVLCEQVRGPGQFPIPPPLRWPGSVQGECTVRRAPVAAATPRAVPGALVGSAAGENSASCQVTGCSQHRWRIGGRRSAGRASADKGCGGSRETSGLAGGKPSSCSALVSRWGRPVAVALQVALFKQTLPWRKGC